MRILVTGMLGMLGREVVRAGNDAGHRVFGSQRQNADISDWVQAFGLVRQAQPDVIINCAGIVRGRAVPHHEYIRSNSLAPHVLAGIAEEWGARVIQVSTDCVFSGRQTVPYTEADIPDATDIYGRSKAAGELTEGNHLTVRASFVGLGERGLLSWLFAQEGNKIDGYTSDLWNGVTAPVMGRSLIYLAERPSYTGIVHICGQDLCKCDLLEMAVDAFGLKVEVEPVEGPPEHHRNMLLASKRMTGILIPQMVEMLQELKARRDEASKPQDAPPTQIRPNIVLPNRAERRAIKARR